VAAGSYAEDREYGEQERGFIFAEYIREKGRVKADEVMQVLGYRVLSAAYKFLDRISIAARLYKDGEYYVQLPIP
jgi:hypothetical protein